MIKEEKLPPTAVNILRVVDDQRACNASTVESLKTLLLPQNRSTGLAKSANSNVRPRSKAVQATSGDPTKNRSKKGPPNPSSGSKSSTCGFLDPQTRLALATNVVNATLKSLTNAVRESGSPKKCFPGKQPQKASIPRSPSRTQSALQPLNINQVLQSPRKNGSTERLATLSPINGCRAQAECARVGLACLRTLQTLEDSPAKFATLQLETAMSSVIAKFIALQYDDLALKELRILKRRLEALALNLDDQVPRSGGFRTEEDAPEIEQKDSLSGLLRFNVMTMDKPLLRLVFTSQIQVLRSIAAKGSAAVIASVVQHLRPQVEYSPISLLNRLLQSGSASSIGEDEKRLGVLVGAVQRLVAKVLSEPSESMSSQKNLLVESHLELRCLALQLQIRWWKVSGHVPDLQRELVDFLVRSLGDFRRRYPLENGDKYELAIHQNDNVMRTLKTHFPTSGFDHTQVQILLAEMAIESRRTSEAKEMLRSALEDARSYGNSTDKTSALRCRVACLYLKDAGLLVEDDNALESIKLALSSLEGPLPSGSIALDELWEASTEFRKAASAYVQGNLKSFEPDAVLRGKSILGLATQVVLFCVKLCAQYIGKKPCTNRNDSATHHRYAQRNQLARRAFPGLTKSLVAVVQLSLKCSHDAWSKLDAILIDYTKICAAMEEAVDLDTQNSTAKNVFTTSYIALSQIYWQRHLFLNKDPDDKDASLNSLRQSIDILRCRPVEVKTAGRFQQKLEKCGNLLESLGMLNEALGMHEEAFRYNIEAGILLKATSNSHTMPFTAAMAQDGDTESFDRLLFTYPTLALKIRKNGGKVSRILLDAEDVSPEQRGLILERQCESLIGLLTKSNTAKITAIETERLTSLLFSIYSKTEFPVQRLYILNQFLHFALASPTLFSKNSTLLQVSSDIDQSSAKGSKSTTESLRCFLPHLFTRCKAYRMIQRKELEPASWRSVLEDWSQLLECADQEILCTNVYSIGDWISQLEFMADFFLINGNETQRIGVLQILVSARRIGAAGKYDHLVSSTLELGLQYTRLGYSGLAGVTFTKAERYLGVSDLPTQILIKWNICKAEHYLECGNLDRSYDLIIKADQMISSDVHKASGQVDDREPCIDLEICAYALLVGSKIAMERGFVHDSMRFARMSVQYYHRWWAKLERKNPILETGNQVDDAAETVTDSLSNLSLSEEKEPTYARSKYSSLKSPKFWTLAPRLFESMLHLSQLYGASGLLVDSQYYLDECEKLASVLDSPFYSATCFVFSLESEVREGHEESLIAKFKEAEQALSKLDVNYRTLQLFVNLAQSLLRHNLTDSGYDLVESVIRKIQSLNTVQCLDYLTFTQRQEKNSGCDKAVSLPKRTQSQSRKKQPATQAPKLPPNQISKSTNPENEFLALSDTLPLHFLKARSIANLAQVKLMENSPDAASSSLDEVSSLPCRKHDLLRRALLSADLQMRQAFKALASNPLLSAISESTISCPATVGLTDQRKVNTSPQKPHRKGRTIPTKSSSKNIDSSDMLSLRLYCDHFLQAQKSLETIDDLVKVSCSTTLAHMKTDVLTKALIMLSMLSPGQQRINSHYLLHTLELGRAFAMERDTMSIKVDQFCSSKRHYQDHTISEAFSGQSFPDWEPYHDITQFQTEYVDIIPSSWVVVSITLSSSKEELLVSKIRSGHRPFVLRLPFNRENDMECDTESFDFEAGKMEMLDIIKEANTSAHSTADLSRKGAKTEWWNARNTLDIRLKDLLTNIENIWFGGFRGIFSARIHDQHLLARFQQSFENTLDRHLPSRQKQAKSQPLTRVILERNVLELFLDIGDTGDLDGEVEDQLQDLLYFVVDILQFNGERNAYDEIDFDAIAVEILDAIRHFYQGLDGNSLGNEYQHTILILDKNLHCFPWESMPCLNKRAISRLPSISCLRRRILEMQKNKDYQVNENDHREGIFANSDNGTYILNPGSDLSNTQATLEAPLQILDTWQSVVRKEPNEEDMKRYLKESDIFLYFGHGSGGQYIRSRTVKKLDKCAAALLMGCSSGTLTQAGDYEPYGTPVSYMHAGCPALVATLWDVTDKDIDRYSKEVLATWGLLRSGREDYQSSPVKKSSKQKGKSKLKEEDSTMKSFAGSPSLDDAVAKSRESCFLRYLNGAAPVVYGIPVYLR